MLCLSRQRNLLDRVRGSCGGIGSNQSLSLLQVCTMTTTDHTLPETFDALFADKKLEREFLSWMTAAVCVLHGRTSGAVLLTI